MSYQERLICLVASSLLLVLYRISLDFFSIVLSVCFILIWIAIFFDDFSANYKIERRIKWKNKKR